MRRTIFFLICALLAAASPEDDIRKAEKDWAAAVTSRDFAALQRIYDDQLIYAHSTGAVETKQQYLDRLKTGIQQYDQIEFQDTIIRIYRDSAVAHSHRQEQRPPFRRPAHDAPRVGQIERWVEAGRASDHKTPVGWW